ncbi:MAG: glycoside hydrolase family 3 N-terminal domain-containing protein [Anaerolineae bacterium]
MMPINLSHAQTRSQRWGQGMCAHPDVDGLGPSPRLLDAIYRLKRLIGQYTIRFVNLALVIAMLAQFVPGGVLAQEDDTRIRRLIDNMSVEERVGQLFLVSFMGEDTSPGSDIAQLIRDFKVGGVLVDPHNGNFQNAQGVPAQVARLTAQLQSFALADPGSGIPLLIAIEADGDGAPTTLLREGMTAVPSPLALGATWTPANAQAVGQIVGQELSAVGVNLLLGPPLDALLTPRPGQPGDLKTRSYGGSPYWVGQMGQAYIQGVHEGSEGRVATVAKHFPGHGSSDRSPDQEAATVEKSLEEMVRADLVPFLKVTDVSMEEQADITDALMTSHLRYRGFQGPTRPGSPPISFDPGGLKVVMDLPQLAPWRETGLLVSDSLGVPAVRRHFSPSLESFPQKEIAQKALLAGNDLLLVSRFALQDDDWTAQFANITSAIRFFREKYETDNTFQARVDEALTRILHLKMKLYPNFKLASVAVGPAGIEDLVAQPKAESQVAAIAQSAVALIAPGLQELADRLPTAPRSGESILIFTDARLTSDCPECEPFQLIPETAIEDTILRLYGPDGTDQIDTNDVHSFTYQDLKAFLIPPDEQEEAINLKIPPLTDDKRSHIEELLKVATWILFAMQDINPESAPESDALRIFLTEQSSSLVDKRVIVMAYGAPYYLDATEISKLTAYYAIFSKIPASIEASVRVLFQEFAPARALPVSVPGITYDLRTQLQPAGAQDLTVSRADKEDTEIRVGEEYVIQTSMILDKNGHPVPDGAKVTFWLTDPTDSTYLELREAMTVDGVARASLRAERVGTVEIRVETGEAETSEPLALTIKGEAEQPTATAEPPTPTATLEPTATPAPPPIPEPVATPPRGTASVGWGSLALSMLGMLFAGIVAMSVDNRGGRALPQSLRVFLLCLTAGFSGYVIVGLQWLQVQKLPGLSDFPLKWHTPLVSTLFALIPLVWAVWDRRHREL